MYRKKDNQISFLDDFKFFAGGRLDANNRWVKMAKIVPWDNLEEEYASLFPSSTGNVANGNWCTHHQGKVRIFRQRNGGTDQREPVFAVFHRAQGVSKHTTIHDDILA